jgi:hypothetical protein
MNVGVAALDARIQMRERVLLGTGCLGAECLTSAMITSEGTTPAIRGLDEHLRSIGARCAAASVADQERGRDGFALSSWTTWGRASRSTVRSRYRVGRRSH